VETCLLSSCGPTHDFDPDALQSPDPSGCGDGVLGPVLIDGTYYAEECDDGNRLPGDGCSEYCFAEQGWNCPPFDHEPCQPICGDGLQVGDEVCDPGVTPLGPYCDDCARVVPGQCGDGEIVDGYETCDDGNPDVYDGCTDCAVDFAFTCTGSPSQCVASGVDGDLLVGDLQGAEAEAMCVWMIDFSGGPNQTLNCGSFDVEVFSVSRCASRFETVPQPDSGHCSVSQIESIVAGAGSACAFYQITEWCD